MFGKDQPEVVTEEDVGNFVAELEREGLDALELNPTEQKADSLSKQRSQRGAIFAIVYGSDKPIK